jgi:hypothetical protein
MSIPRQRRQDNFPSPYQNAIAVRADKEKLIFRSSPLQAVWVH